MSEDVGVSNNMPLTSPPSSPVQVCLDQANVAGQAEKENVAIVQPKELQESGGECSLGPVARFLLTGPFIDGDVCNNELADLLREQCVQKLPENSHASWHRVLENKERILNSFKGFHCLCVRTLLECLECSDKRSSIFSRGILTSGSGRGNYDIENLIALYLSEHDRAALCGIKPLKNKEVLFKTLNELTPSEKKSYVESLFKNPRKGLSEIFLKLSQEQIADIASLFSKDPSCLVSIWNDLVVSKKGCSTVAGEGLRCILLVILSLDNDAREKAIRQLVAGGGAHVFANIINLVLEDNFDLISRFDSFFVKKAQFLHLILRSLKNELGTEGYIQSFKYSKCSGAWRIYLLVSALFYKDSEEIDSTDVKCLRTILNVNQGRRIEFAIRGLHAVDFRMPNGRGCIDRIIKNLSAREFGLLKLIIGKLESCHGKTGGMYRLLSIILNVERLPADLLETFSEDEKGFYEDVLSEIRGEEKKEREEREEKKKREKLLYRICSGARRFFGFFSWMRLKSRVMALVFSSKKS